MSYFNDQEKPIDYTSKYNEIDTNSPKLHAKKPERSHLQSYHSLNQSKSETTVNNNLFNRSAPFAQFHNYPSSSMNHNRMSNSNSSITNQEKFNQTPTKTHDSLDSGDFTYLYEDVPDSLIVYQTENTPICFSNDSPLSCLSIECLPNFDPKTYNNFNSNDDSVINQETEFNSYGDSLLDYNMEGTPVCFSYDSPLSPLSISSLHYDDPILGNTTGTLQQQIARIKEYQKNKEQDVSSMISSMSIENNQISTRSSSFERLNKKSEIRFGQLNSDTQSDGFSLLDFDTQQQKSKQQDQSQFDDEKSSKISNQNRSLVNQKSNLDNQFFNSNQLIDKQSIKNENQLDADDKECVDFENGFDDANDKDEYYYLNECISRGRLSNRNNFMQSCPVQHNQKPNQSLLSQQKSNLSLQFNRSNDSQQQQRNQQQSHHQSPPQQRPQNVFDNSNHNYQSNQMNNRSENTKFKPSHLYTFGKQEMIFDERSTQMIPQNRQNHFIYQIPEESNKKIQSSDETSTTLTNYSAKLCSRSMYGIDGKEEQHERSVVGGPVHLPFNSPFYMYHHANQTNLNNLNNLNNHSHYPSTSSEPNYSMQQNQNINNLNERFHHQTTSSEPNYVLQANRNNANQVRQAEVKRKGVKKMFKDIKDNIFKKAV